MASAPFTAIPNWLIEAMPHMPGSVFQVAVVIARQTVGYSDGNGGRKEWDRISVSQFQAATGLSRKGVQDAIVAGCGKWFDRRPAGQYFEYQLCNSVAQLDHATELAMQDSCIAPCNSVAQSDDELCNSVAQHTPELCNSVDPQKKEKQETKRTKRNKGKESGSSAAAPQARTPTPHQQFFEAVCWIVGWDYKTLTKDDSGRVAQTVGILQKAEYTLDDLRRFFLEIWAEDWRWKKEKQRPTLTQLRQEIGKLRAGIPVDMPVNGRSQPTGGAAVAALRQRLEKEQLDGHA